MKIFSFDNRTIFEETTALIIRLFGKNIFSLCIGHHIGWVRFFYYFGFKWKDVTEHPLTFSERQLGHGFQFRKWRVGVFK